MSRSKTPTFLLELPLQVTPQQASHLRAHFEAARCLYNALLGEAMKRLKHMRADPGFQQARGIPKLHKQERAARFWQLRREYGFSEYALHAYATKARTAWIADHIDSNTAQKLATRAYQAANRVCLGQAHNVRFKSRSRGLDSIEGKTNKQGADCEGYRYYAQLAVEGIPYQKPKHHVGTATVGLDLGPSTLAIVPAEGEARLLSFCNELKADKRKERGLQRKLDRQRRANNPQNYDHLGRIKKGKKPWKDSRGYKKTRRRLTAKARQLAAHRKSLHGRLVHELVRTGKTIITEKLSYKAWQKQYGKSVGTHAPGMFMEHLRRTRASNWRHPA
jgi:hypothetical protein